MFNANTGAILQLADSEGCALAKALCIYPASVDPSGFDQATLQRLTKAGFIVEPGLNEFQAIRDRFEFSRQNAATVITVMVTNDCNLGCYYCFQSRTKDSLEGEHEVETLAYLKQRIADSGKDRVHVNWYGGEPMLKRDYIARLSSSLQAFTQEKGLRYEASILSNGTFWPDVPLQFVRDHKLTTVQITFDGMETTHNKIRRKLSTDGPAYNQFEQAVRVVDAIHRDCHVEVRFNLGPRNTEQVFKFVEFCKKRGWFTKNSLAKLQLAKISPYSEAVDFIRSDQLLYAEFETIVDEVRRLVPDHFLDANTALGDLPKPRRAVCSAIADDSFIVGADSKIYNCGLQVGNPANSVAALNQESLQETELEQAAWWQTFDPTERPKCKECTFLPLCWGSCPKLHLEGDDHYLDEQSEYWRSTLPKRILNAVGAKAEMRFTEADQFKTGSPDQK